MAIISFDRDAVVDFVPAYGNNRETEKPCVVRLRYVPYSRVQHYSRLLAARTKGLNDHARLTELAHEVQKRQFVESVESVSGYYVNGAEANDPAALYDTAPTELIHEIIRAMEDASRLSEGQLKNS
jgi:hypothetical protein